MNHIYGYIRVSTKKQGEGVSLEVQKADIERFAKQKGLNITRWYQEKKSASKGFRPEFNRMIADLHEKKANGFIIHKIDRISRNNHDWAIVNDLIDQGYEVHSATESLNLKEVSGRMVADFHALIATNYSRNLSQESKKGLYGRLKQGIYPFRAPVGYLDQGKGVAKAIDPIKSPLVIKLFRYYVHEGYSIRELTAKMNREGLTNSLGNRLDKNGVTCILKNSFYTGIISVKGRQFQGAHKALISQSMFKKAQDIMVGKTNAKKFKHNFQFRKRIRCNLCKYRLTGERQKGHIYYRCHTRGCAMKSLRESTVNLYVSKMLRAIVLTDTEAEELYSLVDSLQNNWQKKQQQLIQSLNLRLGNLKQKLNRATDALLDGTITKEQYQAQEQKILANEREILEQQNEVSSEKSKFLKKMSDFFELSKNLEKLYELANMDEKRELLEILTSNLEVEGSKLVFTIQSPFSHLVNRDILMSGPPNHLTDPKKECTITFQSTMTSPVISTPLDDQQCNEFLAYLVEETTSLPDLNLPNLNVLQTNHPNTERGHRSYPDPQSDRSAG